MVFCCNNPGLRFASPWAFTVHTFGVKSYIPGMEPRAVGEEPRVVGVRPSPTGTTVIAQGVLLNALGVTQFNIPRPEGAHGRSAIAAGWSIPHITLIVFEVVFFEEPPVFILKCHFAMMFLLSSDAMHLVAPCVVKQRCPSPGAEDKMLENIGQRLRHTIKRPRLAKRDLARPAGVGISCDFLFLRAAQQHRRATACDQRTER